MIIGLKERCAKESRRDDMIEHKPSVLFFHSTAIKNNSLPREFIFSKQGILISCASV
jgi:hypothetical protein